MIGVAAKKKARTPRNGSPQRETNQRLGRIEKTLETSSKLFVLMHQRLEHLEEGQQALVEGQQALVEGQQALVEGQLQVIDRLDRLVELATRDRTEWAARFDALERRVSALEEERGPN